jgi:hypothetical protein
MMNLNELDYPIPDPAWDYANIYHRCHHTRQEKREAAGLYE